MPVVSIVSTQPSRMSRAAMKSVMTMRSQAVGWLWLSGPWRSVPKNSSLSLTASL